MDGEEVEEQSKALIVFARLPVPGKVKTRLAAGLGKEGACQFYKVCAEHVLIQGARCDGVKRYLFYSNKEEKAGIISWLKEIGLLEQYILQYQVVGDVGERMEAAFLNVLSEGATHAVIVGTDIPDLKANLIMSAFRALSNYDVVFGPSRDGGYYLLGMKAFHKFLFRDIPWSTEFVLSTSSSLVLQNSLKMAPVEWLPRLHDIDTAKDLEVWLNSSSCFRRMSSKEKAALRSKWATAVTEDEAEGSKPENCLTRMRLLADWLLYERHLVEEAMAENGYFLQL